jgi:hypothetical protein
MLESKIDLAKDSAQVSSYKLAVSLADEAADERVRIADWLRNERSLRAARGYAI